jgi:ribosomal protein L17
MNTKEKAKAFEPQVEPMIGLGVEKYTEAKDKIFNKEQELFYRATDYRGS